MLRGICWNLPDVFLGLLAKSVVWHFIGESRIDEKKPTSTSPVEWVRETLGFASRLGITPRGDGDNEISLDFRERRRRWAALSKKRKPRWENDGLKL